MKLNLRDGHVAEKNYTPTKTKKIGIDQKSMELLGMLITQGLYSNPIGSTVRELSSNSWDSHIEAEKAETPIVAGLRIDNNGTYFFAQDFGVGISPYRFEHIYGELLSSTKRETNDQLGAFGLGSKSPLSYTNIFYVTTVYEGIEYGYSVYINGNETTQEEMYQIPSTECNGTIVKVYLKRDQDIQKFVHECLRQLVYFDNIVFEFPDSPEINDYNIFRGKSFMYSPITSHKEVHAILGKVAYPLDWVELGMNKIEVPIGLRFEVGDFSVTPSRESIQYDEDIIEKIKAKIEEASTELAELFNANPYNYTFEDIVDFENRFKKGVPHVWLGDNKLSLLGTRSHTDVELEKPRIKRFGDLDCTDFNADHPMKFIARDEYYIPKGKGVLHKCEKKRGRYGYYKTVIIEKPTAKDIKENPSKYLWYSNRHNSPKKTQYISEVLGEKVLLHNTFDYEKLKPYSEKIDNVEKPGKKVTMHVIPEALKTICKMFGFVPENKSKTDRAEALRILNLYRDLFNEMVTGIEHYKDIEMSAEWLADYSERNKTVREKGDIKVNYLQRYHTGRYGGGSAKVKMASVTVNVSTIEDALNTQFGSESELVLFKKDDRYKYARLFEGYSNYMGKHFPNTVFINVADSNTKHLEDIDFVFTAEEWFKMEREHFDKFATLTHLQDIIISDNHYGKIDEYLGTNFKSRVAEFNKIERKLSKEVNYLEDYNIFTETALEVGKPDKYLINSKANLAIEIDQYEYLRFFNLTEPGVDKAIQAYLFCTDDGQDEEQLNELVTDFEVTNNTQSHDSLF